MNALVLPKFRLSLLARFELSGPKGPVDLSNRKLAGLLAYLACTAPLPQSRQKLATLLWGSHFETQAQQNLRQALFRLRRALGTDALRSAGDEVWLAPGTIDCDVVRFEALCGEGSRTSLAAAADLYHGALLADVQIAEEAWTDWLGAERRRLEDLALDAMIRHAAQALHSASAESALKVAHRAIALNALREDAHRVVLQALAATGRKAEALKHYQELVVLLRRELNAEPDAVTRSLVAGLRSEAGLASEAIDYSVKAGKLAYARSAHREAVEFFDRALGNLASSPESLGTLEQACDIRLELPQALIQLGQVRRALERLQEAKLLAERLDDDQRRGRVSSFMAIVQALFGELDEALSAGLRAQEIARRLGDVKLLIPALTILQQVHFYRGEHERVTTLATENLALLHAASAMEDFGLATLPSVYDRGRLIISLAELGRFANATELEPQTLQLVARTRHAYTVGWAHLAASWVHLLRGDWARASPGVEHATAILRTGDVVPLLPFAVGLSAWGLAHLGEESEALSRLREGEQLLERHALGGQTGTLGWFYGGLGRAALVLGRLEQARRLGDRALEFSPRQPGFAAHALQLLGDIASHRDRFDAQRAEAHYRQALMLAEPCGMRPVVAHCHLGLGRLYRRTGALKRGDEHLATATTMYREMDMPFWHEQADAATREPAPGPRRDRGEKSRSPALPADDTPIAIAPAVPTGAGSSERRQLTIMSCNIVGSMALAARLDPEDMRALIDAFHKEVAAVVSRFDGFVAQYLGDGVIVYFGYPAAHEHDAERAVRAGLAILDVPAGPHAFSGIPVPVRIGIATGVVVVGERLGPDGRGQCVAIGETPNMAARLQALAGPGEVVIAAGTRRLVGQLFDCRALVADEPKGLPQPAEAWQVRGEAAGVSRFEARRAGALSPLVGRKDEMELLLRRWGQARLGEGRVVLISGEPGIGKSRIAESLLAGFEGEPQARQLYFCSPHHERSVLHPFVARLERAAGFAPGSNSEARLDRLEALLQPTTPRELALMADLLGVPTGGRYPELDANPQQQRELTLVAILDQLDRLAAQGPVLIVLEDAHWIDPTSQDLLDRTVTHIANRPVLLVVTARLEFQPVWLGLPHVTVLPLSRLGRRDSTGIIAGVTGGKTLPATVVEQVLAHTDGVPLFIEELTSTLLESGLLRETPDRYVLDGPLPPLAVPTTLQASLVARLDRLGPARDVAQIGAVIGRAFSRELIGAVSTLSPMVLDSALERLTTTGLISRRGAPPDAIYSFKHALVQDAAYATMLKSRRQPLHASIATMLIDRFPAMAESVPEVVARHFTEAGLAGEAIGYWIKAGRLASMRSACPEAVDSFEQALSLLQAVPENPPTLGQAFDTRLELRLVLTQLGECHRALTNLRSAEALAKRLADDARLGRVYVSMTNACANIGEMDEALASATRALKIAGRRGDETLRIPATTYLEQVHYHRGDYERVVELAAANLASLREEWVAEHFGLNIPPSIYDRFWLVMALAQLGRFAEAAERQAEAMRLAGATRSAYATGLTRFAASTLHVLREERAQARSLNEWWIATMRAENYLFNLPFAVVNSAWAHALPGDAGETVQRLREGEKLLDGYAAAGFLGHLGWHYHSLGHGWLQLDRLDEARRLGQRALELSPSHSGFSAHALRLLGDIAIHPGRFDAAGGEVKYRQALALAEPRGMRPLIAHCHAGLGKLHRHQGAHKRANQHLATATSMYREMDMPVGQEPTDAATG